MTPLRALRTLRTSSQPQAALSRTVTASQFGCRLLSTSRIAMAAKKNDWSADQYLKFNDERTRAVHDLVNRIPLPGGRFPVSEATSDLRIIDLGCGPGNSTAVLAERFPGADVSGVDSSPNMIEKAKKSLPSIGFGLADLRTYDPTEGAGKAPTLLLANAVFQWISLDQRLPTILRLFNTLPSGGVLAYQVPDNKAERTHQAMGEVGRGAAPGTHNGPWVPTLKDLHDRDPIESVEQIYDALVPHSASVDVWHSVYNHVMLRGAADIVEWMRGTGLQPWINALPDDATKQAFLQAYEKRLGELYETRVDGTVLIHYPRLFVVAVKK
ncbi:trans-aconitate 2-methyltransferase [Ophiostoma piceae UAMH 11346]|uniref:Trans-aconitate 2-methyltransferase n=1 Tax=Ophiostoma piceae (strain UAMH 11346) TaxID=1262450 RepID=S3C9G5_OPHP1|nr:trans-aconitate 2-methyltransferase [Ophiostoma piceae UAMH 11346]